METKAASLLAYICQHPENDVARLVYADWLEDHGEGERGEFIRVGVELTAWERRNNEPLPAGKAAMSVMRRRERELLYPTARGLTNADIWGRLTLPGVDQWTFRRGFPAEITLPTESFAGGPCGRCSGSGWVRVHDGYLREDGYGSRREDCSACDGTSRTSGHAAALFRAAPIEHVHLSDKHPFLTFAGWWGWSDVLEDERNYSSPGYLPHELYALLTDFDHIAPPTGGWETESRASAALDAAATLYGRRLAWTCPACTSLQGGFVIADPCPVCRSTGHTVEVNS